MIEESPSHSRHSFSARSVVPALRARNRNVRRPPARADRRTVWRIEVRGLELQDGTRLGDGLAPEQR